MAAQTRPRLHRHRRRRERQRLGTSNPVESSLHREAWEWAKRISEHLLPKSRAYAEIWLDGEKVETTETAPPWLKV